ncbi:MAG: hypothetical protein IH943_07645 [Acidobacteria bacterium]|nr:hypothetical protein [Acidobacteriota bacterium]
MRTAVESPEGVALVGYALLIVLVLVGYALLVVLVAITSLITMRSLIPTSSQSFEPVAHHSPR